MASPALKNDIRAEERAGGDDLHGRNGQCEREQTGDDNTAIAVMTASCTLAPAISEPAKVSAAVRCTTGA